MGLIPPKEAVLLHMVKLPFDFTNLQLSEGITCGKLKGSQIGVLYEKLCYDQGIDDGDPFSYEFYFDINTERHHDYGDHDSPFNIVSRLCNITTICTKSHFGMVRLIGMWDDYLSACRTSEIFTYTEQHEQTDWHNQDLPIISIEHLKKCWEAENTLLHDEYARYQNSRVGNALIFFFYAWRSYHIEQACIHLAISIESLFSPNSPGELSHQLSLNAAKFHAKTGPEQAQIYDNMKSFYSIRSQLVHGQQPRNEKVLEVVDFAFPFICDCLHKLLLDLKLLRSFNDNSQRRELFRKQLFE